MRFFNKKTESALTKEDLIHEHNVLQISFKSNSYDWKTHESKKIDIIFKHADDNNKKYSETTALFSVSGDKQFIKTTNFIGQADKTSTSGETLADYKCSWEEAVKDQAENCKVSAFTESTSLTQDANTSYSSLTFKKGSAATKVAENNFYQIEWTPSSYVEANNNMIIFSKATQTVVGAAADEEIIKFTKVKRSLLVGENLLVFNNMSDTQTSN